MRRALNIRTKMSLTAA